MATSQPDCRCPIQRFETRADHARGRSLGNCEAPSYGVNVGHFFSILPIALNPSRYKTAHRKLRSIIGTLPYGNREHRKGKVMRKGPMTGGQDTIARTML